MKLLNSPLRILLFLNFSTLSYDSISESSNSSENVGDEACTITCPADIVVTLDPGACDTVVNYTVVASMCSGTIVQTSGLPSGSNFPIGTTTCCFTIQSESCCFDVTVYEFPNPTTTLACNDNIQVSVDENCEAFIETDMILEGGPYSCYYDYIVAVESYGSGFGGVWIDMNAVGQTLGVTVTDPETGNFCWGTITVEDKVPPTILCFPYNIECGAMPDPYDPQYLIAMDNCGQIVLEYTDEVINGPGMSSENG